MTRARALSFAAACAASVLLFADAAHAEDARVLIVAPRATPLVKKLEAELTTAHFAIDFWFVDSITIEGAADIRAHAVARDARVLLRTSNADNVVEVWVADRDGEVVRFRERVTSPSPGDSDLLAVQTHEVVRAALLGDSPAPAPHPVVSTPESLAPPHDAPAPAAVPVPKIALRVGPALLASPTSGLGMGNVSLGVSWLTSERVSLDAVASLAVLPSTLKGPEGSARVGVGMIGAGGTWSFTGRTARVRPSIGVGMALAWTHVDGIAIPPFVSHSEDVVSWLPYVDGSISLGLTESFALCAELLGGTMVPPTRISFGGHEVATSGELVVLASSSVRVTW